MLSELLGINPQILNIIAQTLSILGMALQILSYQFKKNKTYLYLQGAGSVLFAISFLMIDGGLASALVNLVSVLKCFTFAHYSKKHFTRGMMFLFIGLYGASTVISTIISGKFAIMPWIVFLAEIVSTVAIWTDSGRIIRLATLGFISPVWIINNIIYFSIGGILCQTFTAVSIIISIIRYGWKGLDNPDAAKKEKLSKKETTAE